MSTPTTNFGWIKPTVFGNVNTWGPPLNNNLDSQDSLIRRFMNTFWNTTEPSEKQNGTQWIDTSSTPYTWKVYDGTDWITVGTFSPSENNFLVANVVSVGDYKFSALSTDHAGWLLCDGSSVSTTTYSGLYNVIGYAFGGSGANFNLPDQRGRVAGAIGTGTGLTARTLGEDVGTETVTLDVTQMPSHTHSFTSASSLNTSTTPKYIPVTGGAGTVYSDKIDNTGGGLAHNNMQPTLFIGNLFIYAGV